MKKENLRLLYIKEIISKNISNKLFFLLSSLVLLIMPLVYNIYFALFQYKIIDYSNMNNNDSIKLLIAIFVVLSLSTNLLERLARYHVSKQKIDLVVSLKSKLFDSVINYFRADDIQDQVVIGFKDYSSQISSGIDIFLRFGARIISGIGALIYAFFMLPTNIALIITFFSLIFGLLSLKFRYGKKLANKYINAFEESNVLLRNLLMNKNTISSLKIENRVENITHNVLIDVKCKEKVYVLYELFREEYNQVISQFAIIILIICLKLVESTPDVVNSTFSMIWLITPSFSLLPNITAFKEKLIYYNQISLKLEALITTNISKSKPKTSVLKQTGTESCFNHCKIDDMNVLKKFKVENLNIKFDDRVVISDLTFDLNLGDRLYIVGKSGVGKSTLISAIMGLIPIESGVIRLNENVVSNLNTKSILKDISYLDQKSTIIPGSIRDNFPEKMSDKDIFFLIDKVGLKDRVESLGGLDISLDSYDARLSGGERQRLCFARAISKQAELLILDEVSAAQDNENQIKLDRIITEIRVSRKSAILEVTHQAIDNNYYNVLCL